MKPFTMKYANLLAAALIAAQVLSACAPLALAGTLKAPSYAPAQASAPMPAAMVMAVSDKSSNKIDRVAFEMAMRKLWEDHITWTRVYIISALAGLPDADTAAQRLLQNQVDIGNAIKPFYGEQAGDQLTALLKDHILIAAELLAAAKAGDSAKFDDAHQRWHENADQIAAFLHTANPDNWSLSDMKSMMNTHLELTLQEASARLSSDWPGDVAAYDQVHNEILGMADMLSTGIIKQFPSKFK